jgi:hypothetical protein
VGCRLTVIAPQRITRRDWSRERRLAPGFRCAQSVLDFARSVQCDRGFSLDWPARSARTNGLLYLRNASAVSASLTSNNDSGNGELVDKAGQSILHLLRKAADAAD